MNDSTRFLGWMCAVFAVCAFVSMPGFAVTCELKSKTSDMDFLTETWWTDNHLPISGDNVILESSDDIAAYVSGDVSIDYRTMQFKANRSSSLRFYGNLGYVFEMPASSQGVYPSNPFIVWNGAGWTEHKALVEVNRGDNGTDPIFRFTDADFKLTTDAEGKTSVLFDKGEYNFCNPDGITKYTGHTVRFMNGVKAEFGKTSSVCFPALEVKGTASSLSIYGSADISGNMSVANTATLMFSSGGTVSLSCNSASLSDGGTLIIDNGTILKATVGAADSSIPVYGDKRPSLIVSNATFIAEKNSMTLGNTTDGLLRLAGGKMAVTGSNGIQVGAGGNGNGTIELVDGEMSVNRVRLSRNNAGIGNSSVFHQKGGVFNASGVGIKFQDGCTGNNNGNHYVRLDGGICSVKNIFRDSTVTAGSAILSADGGTLRPLEDNATFLSCLTKCEFGPKGLTLDTNGKDVTMKSPVADKEGERGLFVKTGAGTATFDGGVWFVSRTVSAGGTLKFASNVTGPTDLSVVNGGAFSLVGAATTFTANSLTITNGVIMLDPNDYINVSGAISLHGAKIEWSQLPSSKQSVFVFSRELTESEKRMISRLSYSNSLAAGTHPEFSFEYDSATGKTKVKVVVNADISLTDASWTGSGNWSATSNWANGIKPDATKTAVFGSSADGYGVTVASGDVAGALSFVGGEYMISGTDSLHIDGTSGKARIDVMSGAHVISAPVDAIAELPVSVAENASLSLNGGVKARRLEKTGSGRLVLGGVSTFDFGLLSSDGILTVNGASALGETPENNTTISAGTLEFANPTGESMAIPASVGVDTASTDNRVVFKADTDVTLSSFAGSTGSIYKRGTGTLTIDVPEDATYKLTSGSYSSPSGTAVIEFPEDGSAPSGAYAPVSIAEGELCVTGSGTLESDGAVVVGSPVASSLKQASLTVDGATLICKGNLYPGWSSSKAKNNNSPAVCILNGGSLSVEGFFPGYACDNGDNSVAVSLAMTNGTCVLAYNTYLSSGYLANNESKTRTNAVVRYEMNNSKLFMNKSNDESRARIDGSIFIDADNGSFVGASDYGTANIRMTTNANRIYGEMFFRNGSTLALHELTEQNVSQDRHLTLAFDDAEWLYDNNYGDKEWPASKNGHVIYEMRGKGVILKPAEGKIFTTLAPFTGKGGLIVDGMGTVAFGIDTAKFTGTLDVRQGTADFSANSTVVGFASVMGDGIVRGAAIGNVKLFAGKPDLGVLTFDDCSFGGRVTVDLGYTAEAPLDDPLPENLLVAKCSGTTMPDVQNWRLTGTGHDGLKGVFSISDGKVFVSVRPKGFSVILR